MQHAILRFVLGSTAVVPITKAEYDDLAIARDALLLMLFLEEKFDLVAQSYLELENDLLGSTVQAFVNGGAIDYQWTQEKRGLLNRRLLNLLSSARGYLDYVPHAAHGLLGRDSPQTISCIERTNKHYDSSLGYRVMEALRNYSQHRGFPIHALTFSHDRQEGVASTIRVGIAIFTKTVYLREDKKIKKCVLEELEAMGGKVDIKPMMRDHVAALADIHEFLRAAIAPNAARWEGQITSAIEKFKAAFPDLPLTGLAAVVRREDSTTTGEINLFSEFIDYRHYLAKKNSGLKHLGSMYATGEILRK